MNDGRAVVLDDRSCQVSSDGWGRKAVQAALEHEADRVVIERGLRRGGATARYPQKHRVSDVVYRATVYKLCARGELPHVRVGLYSNGFCSRLSERSHLRSYAKSGTISPP